MSTVTWLGQAGFRIDLDGVRCVVDPWASPHEARLVPPPPEELTADGIDWLLVTHEHLDHLDLPLVRLVLERSPATRVVLPAPVARLAALATRSSSLPRRAGHRSPIRRVTALPGWR